LTCHGVVQLVVQQIYDRSM